MATPFPVNAYLTFQVPVSPLDTDDLGNAIATTEPLEVQCYLRASKSSAIARDPAGSSDNRITMEGRIAEPDALPSSIIPGARAQIVIVDPGGVVPNQEGEFFLEGSTPSAFGITPALGAPIKGYFVARSTWGNQA
ncbi:hypothetical protein [Thermoleptolyngbya sp. M55_K2018_002]|uniref:hypothetical protein n=1 Tax=Thermoleptolyngbya sp. M55_K2018_002 TaxID=2747808 RepID=UPI0019DA07F2|nr:hypothetical protein [Thermoleptolyngbya sp. M55_K2018_002]HIK42161.1 hypothetical protein [Thermoleptolyngbya sp. M55_K2018_002]